MRKATLASCFVAVIALSAGAVSGVLGIVGKLPEQPIEFNHRIHIERVQGIQCEDCHRFASSMSYAGLPSKYVCFECHDPEPAEDDEAADARKPQFASLMAFATTEGDIPWSRVTASHDDVFFSHRRHVAVGKVECRTCHPEIPDRTLPPTHGPIEMGMSVCIDCHNKSHASVDCIACHR